MEKCEAVGSNGHFVISGKPGDRVCIGGHGWGPEGAWRTRTKVHEMQADGSWAFIGYYDELYEGKEPE